MNEANRKAKREGGRRRKVKEAKADEEGREGSQRRGKEGDTMAEGEGRGRRK